MPRHEFENRLDHMKKEDMMVTCTSLYAHLLDQLDWGLLSVREVCKTAPGILKLAGLVCPYEGDWTEAAEKREDPVEWMVCRYMEAVLDGIRRNGTAVKTDAVKLDAADSNLFMKSGKEIRQ